MHMISVALGKTVLWFARLRGGGSSLPGLVVERIDRNFLARSLGNLPHGVIVVSGTNGKTTTTKMLAAILEAQGLRVFTNDSGANFSRGVIAALLPKMNWRGRFVADVAVLELDEAHAVKFAAQVNPRHLLLLNIFADQTERFGDVSNTARILGEVAAAATDTLVINQQDELLTQIGTEQRERLNVLGYAPAAAQSGAAFSPAAANTTWQVIAPRTAACAGPFGTAEIKLRIPGDYNLENAVGALTLAAAVTADFELDRALTALAEVSPAVGRGQTVIIDGREVNLVLVKNAAGFQASLGAFARPETPNLIAMHRSPADGSNTDWYSQVDYRALAQAPISVAGMAGSEMSAALQQQGISATALHSDLAVAIAEFFAQYPNRDAVIFCSYTAMWELRRHLK